jgi:hypothetical protein
VSVTGVAETAPRYYPSVDNKIFRRDHAAIRTTVRLPFSIIATGTAAYVPYSVLSLTGASVGAVETDLPEHDFPVSLDHYVTWGAGLGTNHRLTRLTWVSADANYSTRRIGAGTQDFRTATGGGRLRHQVGKGAFLKAGYYYTDAHYGDVRSYGRHLLDVGVDYSRDLSFARRTTLSFDTGTSIVTFPASDADDDGRDDALNRLRLGGSAQLRHEMGRTWVAAISYQRGVQFLEGWPEPLFTDSAGAQLQGSVSRRIQFSASVRASTGHLARNRDDSGFNVYHGGATLTYALNRHLNVGVLYSTYHHQFEESVALPPGFGAWFERHRVIAQVSAWAPLFTRSRRVNVTR